MCVCYPRNMNGEKGRYEERMKFYIDLVKYLSIKPRKIPQGKKYYVSNFKMEGEE